MSPCTAATISFAGSVLSARVLDGALRVVSTTDRDDPLPRYRIERADGSDDSGVLAACDAAWSARDRRGSQLITIATFGLPAKPPTRIDSFLASPVGVAASDDSVLVATNAPTDDTWVHRFDATGEPRSIRTPGRLLAGWGDDPLNRWSLSEYQDEVRIVTRDPTQPEGSKLPEQLRTIVSVAHIEGSDLRLVGRVVKRSPPGTVAGVRLLGRIGIVEPHHPVDRTSVELIDLAHQRIVGELGVPPGETGYLALERDLLLTKRGIRAPYTYTVFDVRDPAHPRFVESIRARTRFWSHAIEQLDTDVVALDGMPDDA